MELKDILPAAVTFFGGLVTVIIFLGKWIIKSIKKQNEGMYKEHLLNKVDIISMDDTLDAKLGDSYTDLKKKKKDELIQHYAALGKLNITN